MPMNFFIYNARAGNSSYTKRAALLNLIKSNPDNIIFETEKSNDEIQLTEKAIRLGAKNIIAVGGDGTLNKVASLLVGTEINLGLIPVGSGNGLARHLGLSFIPEIALHKAINGKPIKIDTCTINNRMFFCTAGIGFDAEVASIFNKRKKRGLLNYIISFFNALKRFNTIEIEINGEKESVFLFTMANANQYGNNAFVSPISDIQDGKLEIVKIKRTRTLLLIPLLIKLFRYNLHKSNKVETISINKMQIKYKANHPIHIDGESELTNDEILNIGILPNSLTIRI